MSITMASWVARHASTQPERVALRHKDRALSWRALDARVEQVARALRGRGVRRGDRVAAMLLNSIELLELLLACTRLGAVFVPINFRLTAPEVEFLLVDAAPELFVFHAPFAPVAAAVHGAGTTGVRHFVQAAGAAVAASPAFVLPPFATGYDALVDEGGAAGAATTAQAAPDDPALMMYTSGTTGRPKAAVLTHGNLLWNNIQILLILPAQTDDVNYTVAPMFHIGGLNVLTGPLLYKGATTILDEQFEPRRALAAMQDNKVTATFMVPAMWAALAAVPDFDRYDLASLRIGIVGGAPCPIPVIEFFVRRGVAFQEGFGLTETAPVVSLLQAPDVVRKNGSVGKPAMHVEVRVVDESDRDVSDGQVGELIVRGPNVTAGYWNRPEETAEAMRNGWFHTGDLARRDDEGFVWIVDRKKDMVISGGENVYPGEVEQVLFRHPGVADAAVIGLPDAKWGEAVVAVLVPRPGATLTLEDVRRHCEGKLAHYKQPSRLFTVDALPRNATGKVLKTELRVRFGGQSSAVTR